MASKEDRNPALAAARWIFFISLAIGAIIFAIPESRSPRESQRKKNYFADPTFVKSNPARGIGPWKLHSGSTGVHVRPLPASSDKKRETKDRIIRVLFSPQKTGVFRLTQTCRNEELKGEQVRFNCEIAAERFTGQVVLRLVAGGETLVAQVHDVGQGEKPVTLSADAVVPEYASRLITIIEAESMGGVLWLHRVGLNVIEKAGSSPRSGKAVYRGPRRKSFFKRLFHIAQDIVKKF
ncbi:MAG: hypothetical protein E3J72_16505 [Planctomycetota bacterium]|nr:MAG: hypothetical protein E3J72_16505 [Planctomycetota bacterium]